MKPQIERALRTHLERHAKSLRGGEQRLGWKVAFNAAPMQEHLGLPHSLVAGLTRSTLCAEGLLHSLEGGTRIALEAEVSVILGGDIVASDDDETIETAIEAIGPAIEVIDINRDFAELEDILAEGVFHRGVVFGEMRRPLKGSSLDGVRARVELDGKEVADVDAGIATGRPIDVLRLIAHIIEPLGETLRAGDHIILGSMNVPPNATAGCRFTLSLDGWKTLGIEFEN